MKKFIIPAFLAIFATNASADENRFYVKGAAGLAVHDDRFLPEDDEYSNATGYSVTFGYQYNNFLALEAGRILLGTAETDYRRMIDYGYSYNDDERVQKTYLVNGEDEFESRSAAVGLALHTDIGNNFHAGVRLGVHEWQWEISKAYTEVGQYNMYDGDGNLIDSIDIDSVGRYKYKDSGFDSYYGAALGWDSNEWTLGLEHTIYVLDERKPSLSAIALTYRF